MLQDTDIGALDHFGSSVEEAVFGNTSIGVDEQDQVADTNIAPCLGKRVKLGEAVLQATLVELGLVSFVQRASGSGS